MGATATTDECPDVVGSNAADFTFTSMTVGAFTCVALGCALCIAGSGFVYHFRGKPVIQVSQPVFLHCFCWGLFVLNASGILRVMNSYAPFYDSFCMGQAWLIHLPLTFLFSILTAKEWRTWKIRAYTNKMKRFTVTENALFIYVGLTMFISIIFLTIWNLSSPFVVQPCKTYQCDNSNPAGFALIVVWNFILAVILLVVVFRDWNMGQLGDDGPGVVVSTISLWAIVAITFATGLSNNATESGASYEEHNQNSLEAFVTYLVCFVCTALSLATVVFHKARYFKLDSQQVVQMFITKKTNDQNQSSGAPRFLSKPSSNPPTGGSLTHLDTQLMLDSPTNAESVALEEHSSKHGASQSGDQKLGLV